MFDLTCTLQGWTINTHSNLNKNIIICTEDPMSKLKWNQLYFIIHFNYFSNFSILINFQYSPQRDFNQQPLRASIYLNSISENVYLSNWDVFSLGFQYNFFVLFLLAFSKDSQHRDLGGWKPLGWIWMEEAGRYLYFPAYCFLVILWSFFTLSSDLLPEAFLKSSVGQNVPASVS